MSYRVSSVVEAARRKKVSTRREREDFTQQQSEQRERAIARWYKKGGKLLVRWTKKHYRMHDGELLEWREPYLEEFFLAIGNPWFEIVFVEKAAQVGFTEALIAFTVFYLAYLRLPFALGFEEQKKLQQMVGKRVQPALDNCEVVQQLSHTKRKITKRQDADNKELITVAGVPLSLFYAGTKQTQKKKNDQGYQAPPSLRSYTAYGTAGDEWGLWQEGIIYIAMARMARSPLPTKPFRAGSTPAYEGGPADIEMRGAKHLFQWRCTCPHCGHEQFIDPFGNFLRPVMVEEGEVVEEMFVDKIGRPLSWFHHSINPEGIQDADLEGKDKEAAIESAYVGCQSCSKELTLEMISTGTFICQNTGITLRELEQETVKAQKVITDAIAIRLPKLASHTFNAPERIRFMWKTKKPDDGIHQFLGKTFSLGGGKISLRRLMACVGLQLPATVKRSPDLVAAGIDQGRHANFLIVQEWYFGESRDPDEQWLDAHVNVVWWAEIQGFDGLDEIARKYGIHMFFIDNEPEFQLAANYALKHLPENYARRTRTRGQVYLVDQMELKNEQYQRKTRLVQSLREDTEITIYNIDRTFALDCVKQRIYKRQFHLPDGLLYNPKDPSNLIHHYLTSERLPDGRWVEPPGEPDHWFNANSFIEIGVQFSGYEPGQQKTAITGTKMR
jgi:hypothetical protein